MNEENAGRVSELKPCPFCGGAPKVTAYETESLWSHEQVTYTKVSCDECDIAFHSEPGYDVEAPQAWNLRAADHPAVGVRELQWRALEAARSDEDPRPEETGDYEAVTPFGSYLIEMGFGSDEYVWSLTFNGLPVEGVRGATEPEKLQAAAQADYTKLIFSCIEPLRPATEQAGGEVEKEPRGPQLWGRFPGSGVWSQIADGSNTDEQVANFEKCYADAGWTELRRTNPFASPPSPAATQSAVVSDAVELERAEALFGEALSGTGIFVRVEDDATVVFYTLDRELRELGSYRFSPSVYHRIDAFIYGVRLASGFDAFCNEVVQAIAALSNPGETL